MRSKARLEFDFLQDIEDAIERILDDPTGLTWGEYLQDYKTQDAA